MKANTTTRVAALAAAAGFGMAYAYGIHPAQTTPEDLRDRFRPLAGSLGTTLNREGAVLAGIEAKALTDAFVRVAGRTPLVWGRYLPLEGRGTIQVIRVMHRPNGAIDVSEQTISPAVGSVFQGGNGRPTYFGGINPFAQFTLGGSSDFGNVSLSGFLTAVGMTMRVVGASTAIVNYQAINAAEAQAFAGDVRGGEARTVTLSTSPRWLIGSPTDAANERRFVPNYRVVGCDPSIDTRHGCIAPGFAGFVPFDAGSLPVGGIAGTTQTRIDGRALDTALVIAAFDTTVALSADRVQAGGVWSTLARQATVQLNNHVSGNSGMAVANEVAQTGANTRSAFTGVTGGATTLISAHDMGRVASDAERGLFYPDGATSPLADPAFRNFVAAPLAAAQGGAGALAGSVNWQANRDRATSADAISSRSLNATQQHSINGIANAR